MEKRSDEGKRTHIALCNHYAHASFCGDLIRSAVPDLLSSFESKAAMHRPGTIERAFELAQSDNG